MEPDVTEEALGLRVERCVGVALREVNGLRAASEQISDASETVLMGPGGALDSLGMVNLAVALETAIESEFGQPVGLVADLLAAENPEAFDTVGRLVTFVATRLSTQAA